MCHFTANFFSFWKNVTEFVLMLAVVVVIAVAVIVTAAGAL